jgi:hypothetical protein
MNSNAARWTDLQLLDEVCARYLSYLKSTFVFRDAELRELFAQELEGGRLINGPFVECTPVYERGTTAESLLSELLGQEIEPAFLAALGANRLLYVHQETAMRRLAAGRNVVVATGTGSGKTEAFLLPILAALYRESLAGPRPPGVRALILYPMNALANDQRRRLGEIARTLREQGSAFSFTFGRYTGETPEDETDAGRKARQQLADRKAGELVLRSEMRQQPPDILLTNYSMLEYLLLRPDDSPLFDHGRGGTWRFCVLDEAHQYRGTKGMEMAMLLRRLRQRLECGGLRRPLQYIATSASLGGGEQDRAELAAFAQQLFASPFTPEDIVLETLAHVPPGNVSIAAQTYRQMADAWHASPAAVQRILAQAAGAHALSLRVGLSPDEALYEILQRDVRLARLRDLVRQPRHVQALADDLFPELDAPERRSALENFLNLVVRARQAGSGSPLVSLRYHLFLRALEGAYVRYHPGKRVSLVPLGEHAEGEGHTRSVAFELALCRECGQHYFVGRREQGYLREALRDSGDEQFRVSFFRPVEGAAADRGETRWRLCLQCGAMGRPNGGLTASSCWHGLVIDVVEEPASRASEDQVHTCGACGYRSQDPVRELIHGNDAPNAVIATAIHRCLPDDRRKVLGFADGRQDAAFFAWYLQDSYEKIVLRNLLFASARSLADEGHWEVSLPSLAARTGCLLRERGAAPESADELEIKRLAWLYLFRELLSDEQRTSLEGVGLVRWMPVLPEKLPLPPSLLRPPWSLNREEALLLMRWLLDSLRADGAIEVKAERGISLQWSDLGLVGKQVTVAIGGRRSEKAWDGPRTRRAALLQRVLSAEGRCSVDPQQQTQAIQDLLREVWEAFRACPGTEPILCHVGDAFRANPGWWRLRVLHEDDPLYCCDTCRRYQAFSIRGVCTRYACPGFLEPVPATASQRTLDHYRTLYVQDLPVRLRAEEHTAQIEPEQARRFQEEFERGHIHFLSCSTTFELGVDLGDLDTIFLRNVPPEPFNYAQRVGRAGRRPSHPGLAVTYCRRRPHDLTHFQDPTLLLRGRTRPPLLRISNAKIVWRHVLAFVLSHFFRSPGHAERFRSVATFLGEIEQPRALRDLAAFVEEHRSLLEAGLRVIVPHELHGPLHLDDGGWAYRLTAADERLAVAISEVCDDYAKVRQCEQEAAAAGNYGKAGWAQRRGKTIANEELISFLSRKAVIPKYGFPVDVVELDLQRAASGDNESTSVSLQRDLAIAVAEFAPGAKLVANKKVWISYGLKRVAEREWDVRRYCKCRAHGTFESWSLDDGPLPPRCCTRMRYGEYVDPLFGFITDGNSPAEPTHRPSRAYTTRPYFLGMDKADVEPVHAGPVTVHKAAPGRLLVLCEGKKGSGFSICFQCGAGAERSGHRTPLGRMCDGRPKRVALGHEFITDVLRITFPDPPASAAFSEREGFAYSLAYALLHGAHEILEVPLTDLNATVGSAAARSDCEIVLYDNVPGGAGLVARLEDPAWLRRCMELARDRVQGTCGCEPSTSCYGCLRSYANQFIHPSLARGPVQQYLEQLLARW